MMYNFLLDLPCEIVNPLVHFCGWFPPWQGASAQTNFQSWNEFCGDSKSLQLKTFTFWPCVFFLRLDQPIFFYKKHVFFWIFVIFRTIYLEPKWPIFWKISSIKMEGFSPKKWGESLGSVGIRRSKPKVLGCAKGSSPRIQAARPMLLVQPWQNCQDFLGEGKPFPVQKCGLLLVVPSYIPGTPRPTIYKWMDVWWFPTIFYTKIWFIIQS